MKHLAHLIRRAAMCVSAASIAGCVQTHFDLATRHQDYTFTSTEKEVAVGRRIAREVEEELTLVQDEPMQERVRSIGQRIAAVCDRREILYHFGVVKEAEVNAFSLPGGYIYLHEGLVKRADSDDELAGVIAHEVAHVAARHSIKRYESSLGLQLAQMATIATRQGELVQGMSLAASATQLAYAREDELDADRLAVKYLKAAGFDPEGILTFLMKLQAVHQEKTHYLPRGVVRPHYGMTHPFVADRLRAVKEELFGVADYLDYLNSPE